MTSIPVPEGLPERVGEVVESASHWFKAQCYQLYQSPPLGAFVSTSLPSEAGPPQAGPAPANGTNGTIYGVVTGIITQSLEPGRPVVARGASAQQEQDIYQENPQLERLLCTRFDAAIVGYKMDAAAVQCLPPVPPRIHAFAHTCPPDEVAGFTSTLSFLELLLASNSAGQAVADEVVAACLRQASGHQPDPRGYLVAAGKALSLRLAMDLPRLNAMLGRLAL